MYCVNVLVSLRQESAFRGIHNLTHNTTRRYDREKSKRNVTTGFGI